MNTRDELDLLNFLMEKQVPKRQRLEILAAVKDILSRKTKEKAVLKAYEKRG